MDIRPQPGAQTKFLSSNADFAIYGGSAGSGKAKFVETLIPTLNGTKKLGSIQQGDLLFDENGNTCRVVTAFEIYQSKKAYKITFDEGSVIIADSDHLWTISGYGDKDGNLFKNLTLTTSELTNITPYTFWIERPYQRDKWKHIFIKSIEPTKNVPVRCLEVDSPSHLFLCGERGIPTHNSYALLLEASRYISNPGFGAVIFRREQKQIVSEGGLRDTALEIYPYLGGQYRAQPTPHFIFPSGAKISFAHLNQESEVLNWQGSQIPMIGYDELSHFSNFQFNYMISRLRSTCGVRPYCRATTNPDSDSWVADLLAWWIDQETGYPIKERSGIVRYFIRVNGEMQWASTREELVNRWDCDLSDPKSLTFISAKISDNPILLKKDPAYLSNLKALSKVERARLLDGNWKVRAVAGMYFPREDAKIIDWIPKSGDIIKWVRSWDLAASEETDGRDPDWTVGMLLGRKQDGQIVVADLIRVRRKAAEVRSLIRNVAAKDGREVWISIPQDPGQAGRDQADSYKQMLAGYTVLSRSITKNKTTMAEPAAALWQHGNIELVRAAWNEELLAEAEQFPEGRHDDVIDSLSAGVRALPGHAKPDYSKTGLSGRFKEIRTVKENRSTPRIKKV